MRIRVPKFWRRAAATTLLLASSALPALAQISITKSDGDDGDFGYLVGANILYTLAVTNGSTTASGPLRIEDEVPTGARFDATSSTPGWSCTPSPDAGSTCSRLLPSLAVDETVSVTFAATVIEALASIHNTACLFDGAVVLDCASDSSNVTSDVVRPLLRMEKDGPLNPVLPGELVEYTLRVENVNHTNCTPSLHPQLTETVPAGTRFDQEASGPGWSCTPDFNAGSTCRASLAPALGCGETQTRTFAVRLVDPIPASLETLVNIGCVADDAGPAGLFDDCSASETVSIDAAPELEVIKSPGPGSNPAPGGALVWAIDYGNSGNQGAAGVTLSDTVPAFTTFNPLLSSPGWDCPAATAGSLCTLDLATVAAGASGSVQFAVVLDDPIPAGVQTVENCVDISSPAPPVFAPLEATSCSSFILPGPGPDPQMVVFKEDILILDLNGDGIANPGESLTYVVSIENRGAGEAVGVSYRSEADARTQLSVGTVTTTQGTVLTGNGPGDTSPKVLLGTIPPGEVAVVTFDVQIADPFPFFSEGEVACQGRLVGANFPQLLSDDPDTPEPDDPTRTPVEIGTTPGGVHEIPTLGMLSLGILGMVLMIAGAWKLREHPESAADRLR